VSGPRPRASAQPSPPLARDSSDDFRAATLALDRGDNRAAADGFARFLASFPGDPRAEDAAYLRVIALQRCGDDLGMGEAARDYLRRYPSGFRRVEVDALSR
jgi:TolA-binding protein